MTRAARGIKWYACGGGTDPYPNLGVGASIKGKVGAEPSSRTDLSTCGSLQINSAKSAGGRRIKKDTIYILAKLGEKGHVQENL